MSWRVKHTPDHSFEGDRFVFSRQSIPLGQQPDAVTAEGVPEDPVHQEAIVVAVKGHDVAGPVEGGRRHADAIAAAQVGAHARPGDEQVDGRFRRQGA